jgi:ATP-binding cassette, subfamily B, bacterial
MTMPQRFPTYRLILRLIRYQPTLWLVDVIVMVIFMLLIQGQALAIQEFFKLIGGVDSLWSVWGLVALLFGVRLARNAAQYMSVEMRIPFLVRSIALLRHNVLRHVLNHTESLRSSPAEALNRLTSDAAEVPQFIGWLNDLIGLVAFALVALVIMLSINPTITSVAVAPLLIITVIARAAAGRTEQYRRDSRQHTGRVVSFIGETFGTVQAVKMATAESHFLAHFQLLNQQRQTATLRDKLFNEVLTSISLNSINFSTGLILMLSASQIRTGTFSVADFALFIYYLELLSQFIGRLSRVAARYQQSKVSLERMVQLVEGTQPKTLVESEHSNVIDYPIKSSSDRLQIFEANHLTYCYAGNRKGIQDIHLRLQRGSFTVITGQVGSGKTTLLRTLLGLLPPQTGDVRWNGQVIRNLGEFMIPPRLAYTPQVPHLFSDSIRENILLGLSVQEAVLEQAIYLSVLESDLTMLDNGLNTLVGVKGLKLSGGQLQRTAIARMFVRQPELVVCDDLSSALDSETEQKLLQRMAEQEGLTCLVVSHRKAVLRQADNIILLKEGKIEAEGNLDYLLETCQEMQQILGTNSV